MNEDIFYIPEIELIEGDAALVIIDLSRFIPKGVNWELLEFLIGCKDTIMLDVFLEDTKYTDKVIFEHVLVKDDIINALGHVLPTYEYVASFNSDNINVVTPNRSFTLDRILTHKPFKIVVLLRIHDES